MNNERVRLPTPRIQLPSIVWDELGVGSCGVGSYSGQDYTASRMQGSQSSSISVAPTQVQSAREALDAWVREVVAWHFDPATGSPFWLDYAKKLGWDPRERISRLRRSPAVRSVRGRMAARRSRCSGGCRAGWRASRSSCSRPAARPAFRRRASTARTSGSTTRSSARRCPTSTSRKAPTG